jgi:ribonuclease E
MSRQRLRPSLGESSHLPCPRCSGQGSIRGVESLSLSILRIIEEEAIKDMTGKVIARLPVETATFLLNEKRKAISDIEQRLDVQIIIVPTPELETPHFQVQRIRLSDTEFNANKKASYMLNVEKPQDVTTPALAHAAPPVQREEPAVKQVTHTTPMPVREAPPVPAAPGFLGRLFGALFGSSPAQPAEQKPAPVQQRRHEQDRDRSHQHRDNRRRRPQGGGNIANTQDKSDRNVQRGDKSQSRQQRRGSRKGGGQQQGGQGQQHQQRNKKNPQQQSNNPPQQGGQGQQQRPRHPDHRQDRGQGRNVPATTGQEPQTSQPVAMAPVDVPVADVNMDHRPAQDNRPAETRPAPLPENLNQYHDGNTEKVSPPAITGSPPPVTQVSTHQPARPAFQFETEIPEQRHDEPAPSYTPPNTDSPPAREDTPVEERKD